jgi:hypothetical protein
MIWIAFSMFPTGGRRNEEVGWGLNILYWWWIALFRANDHVFWTPASENVAAVHALFF